MRRLSMVFPYYMNPGMLEYQYAIWSEYPEHLKQRIEIVLVDDGSPSPAVEVERPQGLPPLRIYRALEDQPWHQHAARNLGAYQAVGPWLFLTDMDHVLPAESLEDLLRIENKRHAYTFARLDMPDLTPTLGKEGEPKPHPNTFAMTRDLFWQVGGYDEDYCGVYGTDGLFRQRLWAKAQQVHLEGVPIFRFPRTVIPDASTTTLPRKEGRDPLAKAKVREWKREQGRENHIATLQFNWTRDL